MQLEGMALSFHNPNNLNTGPMTLNCEAFNEVQIYNCQLDFPAVPIEFEDMIANGDEAAFNALGGIVINPCNPVIITATDLNFNLPESCNDSLVVQRILQVWDQETFQRCTLTIKTYSTPLRVMNHAENRIVGCGENVDSIYLDWINNQGFSEILDCSGATVKTTPPNPVLDDRNCISNLSPFVTNIIQEKRVQWDFTDGCSRRASTVASFWVIDTLPPNIICPSNVDFDISNQDILMDIETHFENVIASDFCVGARIENNFNPNSITEDCRPMYDIPVIFTAIDSCVNRSTCEMILTIINDQDPTITCPAELRLECGSPMNPGLTTQWIQDVIGTDNLGNPLPPSSNFMDQILNDPYCNHEADITFIVTDFCGRSATCQSRIIINDTTAPNISCPLDLDLMTSDPDIILKVNDWLDSYVGQDQCTTVIKEDDLDLNSLLFSCDPFISIPVEVVFSDECGNLEDCIGNINITNDYMAEISCPADLTINCGESSNLATLLSWTMESNLTDNLGNVDIASNDLDLNDPLLTSCQIPVLVTFSKVDLCGNTFDCSSTISTVDIINPNITCPPNKEINNNTNNLDEEIEMWLTSAIATDNCSASNLTTDFNPADFQGCDLTLFSTVTFTATDSCGLSSTCQSDLTVNTDRIPAVNCLPDLEIECGQADNSTRIQEWIDQTLGFDFTGTSLSVNNNYQNQLSNLIICDSTVLVIFVVIDDCLWTDTCRASIILLDTTPPEIICPIDLEINSTIPDLENIVNNWLLSPEVSDNCLTASFDDNFNINLYDFCNTSTIETIKFTATDDCGLESECFANLTVNISDPAIICPAPIFLECNDPANQNIIDSWLLDITSQDNNLAALDFTNDFDANNIIGDCQITSTVTFETVEDSCGNKSNCSSTINLADTQSPIVDCPIDLNLLGGDPNLRIKAVDYIDNISILDCNTYQVTSNLDTSLLVFSCDDVLTFPINLSVTDQCNNVTNCGFTITVTNEITPNIECPLALNIECGDINNDMLISDWLQEAQAGDNTGLTFPVDNNFNQINPNELLACSGVVNITFIMIDNCNSSLTCMSEININDNTPPIIICVNDTTFTQGTPSFDSDISTWLNQISGSDNCSAVNILNDYSPIGALDNCEPSVDLDITFTVTDDCNFSSSCSAILNIRSDKQPAINCPVALVLECGVFDNAQFLQDWIELSTGFDSDGNSLMVTNDLDINQILSLSCGEESEVLFSVTDDCLVTESCISNISIEDTTVPELTCPPDLSISATQANLKEDVDNWINSYFANDNCSAVDVIHDDISGLDFCTEADMIELVFTANDDCGLSSECSAILFVNNNEPVISCTQDLQLECGDINNNSLVNDWLNEMSAVDNAGSSLNVENDFLNIAAILDCTASITPVVFTATDICAKQTQCSLNVIVDDNLAPEITCPSDIEIDINQSDVAILVDSWLNESAASDQCSSASIINNFSQDFTALDCGTTIDVLFTAEDECNNSSDCSAQVSFVNNLQVSIECPEPISIKCDDAGLQNTIASFQEMYTVISQDGFMVFNDLDISVIDLSCVASLTQTVTFTIEDECGNSDDCESSVTFVPNAGYYIPNIFSPNADGNNDKLIVFGNESVTNVKEMNIFNRWGNLVYQAQNFPPNDDAFGWDGYSMGVTIQGGVYVYTIIIEDQFGNEFIETGNITLIP